jgi:hypothetical protein
MRNVDTSRTNRIRAAVLWLGVAVAVGGILSCADQAVRKVARLNPNVPIGRIEDGKFTGQRIPIEISTADTGWEISTEYPKFMLEQGYEKEGLAESQVFVYNPKTRSSIQIELAPAGAHEMFSQEKMERLADLMAPSMEEELDKEYGRGNYRVVHGKAAPYRLQGVPYAAKNFSHYEAKGGSRENGWIYGFAEPFQIFILYQIENPGQNQDLEAVTKILSTFRYIAPAGSQK